MTTIDGARVMALLRAGVAKADGLDEPSCVCVVDTGGHLLGLMRSEGAPFGVVDVAVNKAYTASAFRCTTADLSADSQPGGELYGIGASGSRPYVTFGGGVPLVQDGELVGAVGVSGGPVSADLEIAAAMVDAFGKHPS